MVSVVLTKVPVVATSWMPELKESTVVPVAEYVTKVKEEVGVVLTGLFKALFT